MWTQLSTEERFTQDIVKLVVTPCMAKGLVINYGEGGGGGVATKWENHGSKTCCAPPSRQAMFQIDRPTTKIRNALQ